MNQPAPAAAIERNISKYSVPRGPSSLAGASAASTLFANTGSRNFSKRFEPPRLGETPRYPAVIEKKASTTSGTVIDFGDSWMWCSTSWLARDGLQNVRYTRRNI